ncbi:MAG: ATP-binding cassette domain-containing protein [Candidatus Borkfalkiaceae bacterium]|nr:ATP-binding cassette domain-containing protein [Clostridia bacterium]MDY6223317.1 ATP-binding cassette domain-containing protein [Christensenellaceae bacterium]
MIKIENLSKIYGGKDNKTVALQGINLEIEDGDVYGIIGLSGAGKSTLVRCINLLERPTGGSIYIDGEDLTKVSKERLRAIRRKVSMIFQQFNLLQQRTVLKNVELAGELGGDENRRRKAIELLETVGLGDKLNAYPSQLSGGQQQRVAIARALMTDPKVLLCDEATSALDPDTTRSILDLLKRLNEKLNLTVVIISHQMSVIEAVCNKVAIIDNAKIVSEGTLQDVFLSPKTAVAKKLIYSGKINTGVKGEKLVKLMFDGDIEEPIVTNIIQQCNILLTIFYAETKRIGGKTYGQIMFRLPYYDEDIGKLREYLNKKGVAYEEVNTDDFC